MLFFRLLFLLSGFVVLQFTTDASQLLFEFAQPSTQPSREFRQLLATEQYEYHDEKDDNFPPADPPSQQGCDVRSAKTSHVHDPTLMTHLTLPLDGAARKQNRRRKLTLRNVREVRLSSVL